MSLWNQWRSGGTLQLVFQPIISLENYQAVGYETLTRPYDREGRLLPVEEFFDDVAATGNAFTMDTYVIEALLKFYKDIKIKIPLFWNAHPMSIAGGILDEIRNKFTTGEIVVEITEKGDWPDSIIPILLEHQKAGYRLALDDFGAGYSGLTRLIAIQPNVVKLDRAIVSEVNRDRVKRQLVEAVVHIAPSIGYQVLAEGLETVEEVTTCSQLGVNWGQGFYFARPKPWDQNPAVDNGVVNSLLILRAQQMLANQQVSLVSAEQRWEILTKTLDLVLDLPSDRKVPYLVWSLKQGSSASWKIGHKHGKHWDWWDQSGFSGNEVIADRIVQEWEMHRFVTPDNELLLQDWNGGLGLDEWEPIGSVGVWSSGEDDQDWVLVGWYGASNQWNVSRTQWPEVMKRVLQWVLDRDPGVNSWSCGKEVRDGASLTPAK